MKYGIGIALFLLILTKKFKLGPKNAIFYTGGKPLMQKSANVMPSGTF